MKFCSVVKGNAYGHGLTEFVKLAMECDQHYFGVYSADEAYHISKNIKHLSFISWNGRREAIE
ncbi:MAG: alanine racemase [Chitinophagaceae bacterium]|nr:alanine racemase [Chitinophagaceae bacterium]